MINRENIKQFVSDPRYIVMGCMGPPAILFDVHLLRGFAFSFISWLYLLRRFSPSAYCLFSLRFSDYFRSSLILQCEVCECSRKESIFILRSSMQFTYIILYSHKRKQLWPDQPVWNRAKSSLSSVGGNKMPNTCKANAQNWFPDPLRYFLSKISLLPCLLLTSSLVACASCSIKRPKNNLWPRRTTDTFVGELHLNYRDFFWPRNSRLTFPGGVACCCVYLVWYNCCICTTGMQIRF